MTTDKDPRVITPMPAELLQAVDDYRFENRLPSRAEAIRALLRAGLEASGKAEAKRGGGKRQASAAS